jgi:hypothetical protein
MRTEARSSPPWPERALRGRIHNSRLLKTNSRKSTCRPGAAIHWERQGVTYLRLTRRTKQNKQRWPCSRRSRPRFRTSALSGSLSSTSRYAARRLADLRPTPIEPHPQEPVCGEEPNPTWVLPPQDIRLMSEGNELEFQGGATTNVEAEDRIIMPATELRDLPAGALFIRRSCGAVAQRRSDCRVCRAAGYATL